ncbi:hypothetical protein OH818_20625 [Jiella pelagia]|uniref:Uncharacterized protein n=1 Tax=Jiella pelagia TaxID=2986949 RepID=A0ABY7BWF6_9HYPH|nr:hypothetical protein OH818_20625 [Jiella pelagia]
MRSISARKSWSSWDFVVIPQEGFAVRLGEQEIEAASHVGRLAMIGLPQAEGQPGGP